MAKPDSLTDQIDGIVCQLIDDPTFYADVVSDLRAAARRIKYYAFFLNLPTTDMPAFEGVDMVAAAPPSKVLRSLRIVLRRYGIMTPGGCVRVNSEMPARP